MGEDEGMEERLVILALGKKVGGDGGFECFEEMIELIVLK